MARPDALPANLPPRCLSRAAAAAYAGVSATKFTQLVSDGRMPQPIEFDRRKVWDRLAIDAALDALSAKAPLTIPRNEWDGV